MRAILASGGYSGLGWNINLACSTWPPRRIRLGVTAFGGGGGGGAELEIIPPKTPPTDPPGIPPGTPPTTPTAVCGGSGSSLILAIVFGMTVGAFMRSSVESRLITLTGAAGAGGGGGGGGGGGAMMATVNIVLGSACVT